MTQTATIGRIVHYTLTEQDAEAINRRRTDGAHYGQHVAPVGNHVDAGDTYPLVITRVWDPTLVNGQLLLDGNDALWVTSRREGAEQGQWRWPERTDQ